MHEKYRETADRIRNVAEKDRNIRGVVILGSQVRADQPGDEWSDLDTLVIADDPSEFIDSDEWLGLFGRVACISREIVDLPWIPLTWHVRRVLYDDNRALDFSIMPFDRLKDVLEINREIHSLGYQVLYDGTGADLSSLVEKSVQDYRKPVGAPMTAAELTELTNDILFSVVYAFKKIKRKELWVAVSEINGRIGGMMLRLTEAYNTVVAGRSDIIDYDGRFLEQRTDGNVLSLLGSCFSKYNEESAVRALEGILRATDRLNAELCIKIGSAGCGQPIGAVWKLFHEIKNGEDTEAGTDLPG